MSDTFNPVKELDAEWLAMVHAMGWDRPASTLIDPEVDGMSAASGSCLCACIGSGSGSGSTSN